ncbi:long-chain fatty acid--CoA ligase [Candidatus Sulfidibacterium hydrothermale]|uniref:AMP-dependent synthetase/ligase n=1 Tax=Candidatus Sulfidibacterium hydrothermale TaxID=2875962 RepID=UPI001F0B3114|nr:long-chain fatty acid--CoA ligase [Candidatus Sulfidibacterium hydrothermale]UBM62351.1 long-chain fatty acid--CoA ligase [Candidatus Sulfidibacterium hydrothermale]
MAEIKRIFDLLTHAEEKFPMEVALAVKRHGKWETFSTAEYRKNVDAVSMGLLAMGFEKGDKIATVSNNRPEWNFMDFGMTQIGCVHVSIYPTISDDEYRHILSHSDARILIVSDKFLYDRLHHFVDEIENLEAIYTFDLVSGAKNWREIIKQAEGKENQFKPLLEKKRDAVKPDDLLTLIYTSGTTGLSKGVMLTHKNVVSNVLMTHKLVTALRSGDRALSFLPLCHVLERTGSYVWQSLGISIYYAESVDTIIDAMNEIKANAFITVPRVFEKIYDKIILKGRELEGLKKSIFFWAVKVGDRYDPDPKKRSLGYNLKLKIARKLVLDKWKEALGGALKSVVSGGAALQPRLARIFWAAGIPVQEGYGLTETSPVVAGNRSYFPYIRFGWVGKVLDEVEVKIADDGEILVRGDNVMKGYYKDPEKTRQVLDPDGWFHTGDIGELDKERFLRITDRKKEIFKLSGGKYVAPQMVENTMKESMFIEQLMVIGENKKFTAALIVPDFDYLHAWCHLHGITFRDNKDLVRKPKVVARFQEEIDRYNRRLDHVQQIKVFRLVCESWSTETGELSPTLKLKRKVIKQKYAALIDEIYATEKNPA